MQLVVEQPDFQVYDDVLSEKDFEDLWAYCQNDEYKLVHSQRWAPIWRLSDGLPLNGTKLFSSESLVQSLKTFDNTIERYMTFPSGKPVDHLYSAVHGTAQLAPSIVGDYDTDWTGMILEPFLYPAGAGLSWHQDFTLYTGAMIFYANPSWNVNLGGELLIAECNKDLGLNASHHFTNGKTVPVNRWLSNDFENQQLLASGYGHFILPKPNRLVLLGHGAVHKINRVANGLGDLARASFSGFFVRANIEQHLQDFRRKYAADSAS